MHPPHVVFTTSPQSIFAQCLLSRNTAKLQQRMFLIAVNQFAFRCLFCVLFPLTGPQNASPACGFYDVSTNPFCPLLIFIQYKDSAAAKFGASTFVWGSHWRAWFRIPHTVSALICSSPASTACFQGGGNTSQRIFVFFSFMNCVFHLIFQ